MHASCAVLVEESTLNRSTATHAVPLSSLERQTSLHAALRARVATPADLTESQVLKHAETSLLRHTPVMLDEQMITRALYGGAIEMSLPQRFADVSDFRPVPDHQEVGRPSMLIPVHKFQKDLNVAAPMQVWTDATLDQSVILEIVVSASFMRTQLLCTMEHAR